MTASSSDDELSSAELSPERLLDGGGGEHERRLIASAQLDRVPSSAKSRVAAALGGVLEPQGASSTAPEPELSTPTDTVSGLGARAGLYVVGAGVVASIAFALWLRMTPEQGSGLPPAPPVTAAPPLSAASTAAPGASAPPPAAAARADATASWREQAGDETARAPRVELPPQTARQRRVAARAAPSAARPGPEGGGTPAEAGDSGLLAEVRALEAVSSALGAGQAEPAARELAAYHRRFARGELAVEAGVLAIQIAMLRGDRETARSTAEKLLARPEARHYRARVRELLEGGAPAGSLDSEKATRIRSNEAAPHMRARR